MEFAWNSKFFDIRISSFPLTGGENIFMRILDKSQLLLALENLGFRKDAIEILNHSLNMPYGMILATGPKGSGKTTTLYSALSIINSVYQDIYTIEDPVEYQLPLIRQSQVIVKAGLTFATGLRSILRQDPDVILVGEMRDIETAELAIRSALTGHLVFSTLHTNNAASSLPRLIDVGVELFLLASTMDTIISQRLVRSIRVDRRRLRERSTHLHSWCFLGCLVDFRLDRESESVCIPHSLKIHAPPPCLACPAFFAGSNLRRV